MVTKERLSMFNQIDDPSPSYVVVSWKEGLPLYMYMHASG